MNTYIIRIDCNGSAFEDDPSFEIARILLRLAKKIDGNGEPEPERMLMDINGNTCGVASWLPEARVRFPLNCAGRMYANATDYADDYGPEYGWLVPADYVDGGCEIGDCWIVDRAGDIHPDYSVAPVPFPASAIGEEME